LEAFRQCMNAKKESKDGWMDAARLMDRQIRAVNSYAKAADGCR